MRQIFCSYEGCFICIFLFDFEGATLDTTFTCREHTPVSPDDARFQSHQFDRDIGSGWDPKAYELYKFFTSQVACGVRTGRRKKERFEKIAASLVGHKNAVEIMKILRREKRNYNS